MGGIPSRCHSLIGGAKRLSVKRSIDTYTRRADFEDYKGVFIFELEL